MVVAPADAGTFAEQRYSERYSCAFDGTTIDELEPRSFSFNSPHGACPACTGLGVRMEFDEERITNRRLSISEGALLPWSRMTMTDSWYGRVVEAVAKRRGFSVDVPLEKLKDEDLHYVLHAPRGEKVRIGYRHDGHTNYYEATFEGLLPNIERRYHETDSEWVKQELEKFMVARPCPTCGGTRLRPEALSVTVDGLNIAQVAQKSVTDALRWADVLPNRLTERERQIGRQVLKEIRARLGLPRRRGPGLPDHRPHFIHPVGRRGAAHPPGDPDRLVADGRAVHP